MARRREAEAELQSTDESAEQEENDRSDGGDANRAEIKDAGGHRAPAEKSSAEPPTNEGADNAKQNGDDATRRVPPWHQKLRQCAGNEAEQYPVKPERQTLVLLRRCCFTE